MSKIIIRNQSTRVDDIAALELVRHVIKEGRVSDEGRGYCYLTRDRATSVMLRAVRNIASDTFTLYDDCSQPD